MKSQSFIFLIILLSYFLDDGTDKPPNNKSNKYKYKVIIIKYTMPDYSKCVIYKIACKDSTITDIYIGHTCDIKTRECQHKTSIKRKNHNEYRSRKGWFIRENGGWKNWEMSVIEEFPCENLQEANEREKYWIQRLEAKLNVQHSLDEQIERENEKRRKEELKTIRRESREQQQKERQDKKEKEAEEKEEKKRKEEKRKRKEEKQQELEEENEPFFNLLKTFNQYLINVRAENRKRREKEANQ